MKNILIQPVFIICILLAVGCNLPKPLTQTAIRLQEDTEVYANLTDSVSTGATPWRDFFTDTALQQLISAGIHNNYELLQANQEVKIADIVYFVNQALHHPTLSGSMNAQADRFGFYTMNGIGNFDMNKSPNVTREMQVPNPVPDVMVGLRSVWEIDTWGRLKDLRNISRETMLATIEERKWMVTQLVGEISFLYYEWMAQQYEQEVLNRNILLQENALEIVRALKQGGRATQLAVQQFEAQVYRTNALRYQLNRQMVATESRIHYLCGRFPGKLIKGTTIMQQPLPPIVQEGIPASLLVKRPDISASYHRILAAYAETEAARKAFLPSFTIAGYLGLQSFRMPAFFNAESITAGLAGNIMAPLLQRRQIRGQYAVSEVAHEKTWLEYSRRIRYAAMEVHNALQGIENLETEYAIREKELTVLRSALETANDLYTNGYANYLEVVTAQQSLLEADMQLVELKKQQLQTIIQLYRCTGGGWE